MYCTYGAHLYHKQRQHTCGIPRRAMAISLQGGGGGGWVDTVLQYLVHRQLERFQMMALAWSSAVRAMNSRDATIRCIGGESEPPQE